MRTLLTVDFDYFVPEDPMWDLSHQESLLFLSVLWSTRGGLIDRMKTNGNEVGFWERLGCKDEVMMVSDSHVFAYSLLNGALSDVRQVVMFDAHHDCWEADSAGRDKRERGVYCHNWLRVWMEKGKKRKAIWVKPAWQDACSLPDDMKDRVEVVSDWRGKVDHVHVCRSGCWVPPWMDETFIRFVKEGGKPLTIQDGAWDPMKPRWTEAELKNCIGQEAQIQKMRDEVVSEGGIII